MYNFLFCSAGRRVKLIKDFKETIGENGKIIVADNSIYAPTRYEADKAYTVIVKLALEDGYDLRSDYFGIVNDEEATINTDGRWQTH